MDRVGSLLKSWAQQRNEDDFVDKLHYKVTTFILTTCAFMTFAKEYGGDAIQCWADAEWSGGWIEYAHDICFIENTYYIPDDVSVRNVKKFNQHKEINYYQWVPFFLLGQALLYNLPSLFWRSLNWTSGLHVRAIISMTSNATKELQFTKEDKVRLGEFIYNTIKHRANKKAESSTCWRLLCVMDRFHAFSRLAMLYYIKKVLFLLTSVYQLVLLSRFLGHNTSFWGFSTMQSLSNGEDWQQTGIFPRVTMCDFSVRETNRLARNVSIQCVLMANMINEKIFLGIWCWICILLAITMVNLLQWWNNLSKASNRNNFVYNSLLAGYSINNENEKPSIEEAKEFCKFLTVDGVLLFRLMEVNSSCLISNDVMFQVYCIYTRRHESEHQIYCEIQDQRHSKPANS